VQVGGASKLKLIINSFMGSVVSSLAEAMTLARRAGVSEAALLEVIGAGALNAPIFAIKVGFE
jgi:3-hydroxyisobutyrate dehydrogenase-like beta-hydroxyacid dehydrogenase